MPQTCCASHMACARPSVLALVPTLVGRPCRTTSAWRLSSLSRCFPTPSWATDGSTSCRVSAQGGSTSGCSAAMQGCRCSHKDGCDHTCCSSCRGLPSWSKCTSQRLTVHITEIDSGIWTSWAAPAAAAASAQAALLHGGCVCEPGVISAQLAASHLGWPLSTGEGCP